MPPSSASGRPGWRGWPGCQGRRVAVRTGVWGDAYRDLLRRAGSSSTAASRRVQPSGLRGAGCGALLFQERGNAETAAFFRDRQECVFYGEDDLEDLLEYYLTREDERRALAAAAHARVQGFGFEALWEGALAGWGRNGRRSARPPPVARTPTRRPRSWRGTWQALGCDAPHDPTLAADLDAALAGRPASAALLHTRGLAAGLSGGADGPAAAAALLPAVPGCDPNNAVAGLNLIEALTALGQRNWRPTGRRRALALLGRGGGLGPEAPDAGRFPTGFDAFRVEWSGPPGATPAGPTPRPAPRPTWCRWRCTRSWVS